jgi:ribosomal protein L11 methyltransferase
VSWLKLDLDVAAADAERVSDLLLELGAVSVTMSAASQDSVIEPAPGATPLWRRNQLSALLPLDADLAAVREGLLAHLGAHLGAQGGAQGDAHPDARIEVGFVEDDDWLARWRDHAIEHCFADRLWVVPRDATPPSLPALRLDPGLAFGTGGHPTTRLCLEWLAAQRLDGLRVLDFGCGSGILALAACVLGAGQVVAVDHDPQALLATRENAAYNQISGGQLIVQEPAELAGDGNFDVVVANILVNPLLELASLITALLRPGAMLVLSGLLANQAEQIRAGYPGVRFDGEELGEELGEENGDWLRLSGVKLDTAAGTEEA